MRVKAILTILALLAVTALVAAGIIALVEAMGG